MLDIHKILDEILPKMIELSEDIYRHPELGFKEFRSREQVIRFLDAAGIAHTDVAYTGLTACLDSGKPGPNIGLIAQGKLHYPSGKQEMIAVGAFDDIDILNLLPM